MAMNLMREHGLVTLQVTFRYTANPPELVLDLLSAGQNVVDGRWRVEASSAGVPVEAGPSSQFNLFLPSEILASIADHVAEIAAPGQPLWLLFVRPYGFVGGLNWEEVLCPVLGRPVLRLPDFLERQRENRAMLEVALVLDVPEDEKSFPIPMIAAQLALWTTASSRPNTRVRVFASQTWYNRVRSETPDTAQFIVVPPPDPTTRDPDDMIRSSDDAFDSDPERETSWFDWIAKETASTGVDVVHFVARGYFARSQPKLALTCSPALPRSESGSSYLSPVETARFLDRIGAWACVCSAPPSGASAPIRCFADGLAQVRPGPVLFHDMQTPDWQHTLREWLPFIFAAEPSTPPLGVGGFAYCQPALVAGADYAGLFGHVISIQAPLLSIPDAQTDGWFSAALRARERAVVKQTLYRRGKSVFDVNELSEDQAQVNNALTDTIQGFDEILQRHGNVQVTPIIAQIPTLKSGK